MGAPRRAGHTQSSSVKRKWTDDVIMNQLKCAGDDPTRKLDKATQSHRRMLLEAQAEQASEAKAKEKREPQNARDVLPTGPSDYELRNHIFLEFTHGEVEPVEKIGRVVFKLYDEYAPQACHNFRSICEGTTDLEGSPLTFTGSVIHKIVKGEALYGGDIENSDGTGGQSIFGKPFMDEVNPLRHDAAGVLSSVQYTDEPDQNTSQFCITLDAAPKLDAKHVVFGRVIHGLEVLAKLNEIPVHDEGHNPTLAPKVSMKVTHAGLYALVKEEMEAGPVESDDERDMDDLEMKEAVYRKVKRAKAEAKEARGAVAGALAMGMKSLKPKKKKRDKSAAAPVNVDFASLC